MLDRQQLTGLPAGITALVAVAAVFIFPAIPILHDWHWHSRFAFPIAWLCSAAALVVFCMLCGIGIAGRPAGILIDNRNRVSLAKFQATAWTVVVVSAFITAVATRIGTMQTDLVAVDVPVQLLVVMGLSATSLVLSPVILSAKSAAPPADPATLGATAAQLQEPAEAGAAAVGRLYTRATPDFARWLDLVRGDEVANAAYPDLGKIQQLLFTVVAIGGYAIGLWVMLETPPVSALPAFSSHMVWLIGISHAGYLTYKAAPHTATASTQVDAGGAVG